MKKETKLSRRQLLRISALAGTGAVLAACAPAAAPAAPAATTAPAEAPAATEAPAAATEAPAATEAAAPTEAPAAASVTGTVVVLHRQEYFKELEDEYKKQTEEFIKSIGGTPDVSTINPEAFGDFVAKMTAAVAAGNPPDLTYQTNISPAQLYDNELTEDHTALVEELISKYGDVVPVTAARNGKIEDKWWVAPQSSNSGGWFVRKDWADEAGVDLTKFATLPERLDAALKMSDPAKERFGWGLTVNKSGDGHGLIETAILGFGGRFVDETGQKIALNTPEAVAGVQWLADVYMKEENKKALPPGVESWTDSSNNEAFLAGKIGITANAPSIYAKAKADKNPIFENISWQNFPTMNEGGIVMNGGGSGWYGIMKGAKQQDAARQIIVHFMAPEVFAPLSKLGGGLVMPAYKNGWTEDLLAFDPNFKFLQEILFNDTDFTGFPFPSTSNAATSAWQATGFQSEMMTNIISGKMTAQQAVEDAVEKAKVIFEEKGFPQ